MVPGDRNSGDPARLRNSDDPLSGVAAAMQNLRELRAFPGASLADYYNHWVCFHCLRYLLLEL